MGTSSFNFGSISTTLRGATRLEQLEHSTDDSVGRMRQQKSRSRSLFNRHLRLGNITRKSSDGKYKDRAEMRRQGADDEYKNVRCEGYYDSMISIIVERESSVGRKLCSSCKVEKLLEDFEKRKAEAGEEDADKVGYTPQ